MARLIRNKVMLIYLLLIPISMARSQKSQSDAASAIRGTWVIKSIYRTPNIQGPSLAEQKKLIGTRIVYSDRTLESCGQSVPITSTDDFQVDSADFLANTRARFSDVEIGARLVTEVVLNNRQAGSCFEAFPSPGQDVYLKSKDEILISFEGVFYRAMRKK
jgi:hypothetical protein